MIGRYLRSIVWRVERQALLTHAAQLAALSQQMATSPRTEDGQALGSVLSRQAQVHERIAHINTQLAAAAQP